MEKDQTRVSILGCGWLGKPLALHLDNQGYEVHGSTTTDQKVSDLLNVSITPYQITFDPEMNCYDCNTFWQSDILFYNIPPSRGSDDVITHYAAITESVIEQAKAGAISWIIFAGATSVYPKQPGLMKEEDASFEDASRDTGRAVLKAEELLFAEEAFDTTVIRYGGLCGYGRHPIHYLSGRTGMTGGGEPVNFIHQDDCILIVSKILERNVRNEVFNAVADGHPPRRALYQAAAERYNLEPPQFEETESPDEGGRIVSNEKLKRVLDYTFLHPNPMDY